MLQEQIARYKSLDFFARQTVEGFIAGRHSSPFHGFSAEFSDHRQYNTGESTRNIDWRLYARTDKLFVKQFQEETNLRCQLLIDHSSSMLFPMERQGDFDHPNKLTFSILAAAVLVELLHRQRDAFGLSLLSAGIEQYIPARSNEAHRQHIFGVLDKLLGDSVTESLSYPTDLPEALHLTAEQLHRRSLVILFTDALVSPFEPFLDALRHLRHNKHEVILFHTLHHDRELSLDYEARPYRFIDLETGKQLKLNPAEIADTYSRQMHERQAALQQHALSYRIDYQPVDVALGFHQVILPFLLKRSKHM